MGLNERPIALNQDGPGWACKNTVEKLKAYEYCLNSGTLMWIRDDRSYNMLNDWCGDLLMTITKLPNSQASGEMTGREQAQL